MNDSTVQIDVGLLEELHEKRRGELCPALTYLSGPERGRRVRLDQARLYTLGRSETSDVRLDEPSVSRVHAVVLLGAEGELLLRDCGSSNGTFIDGQRLAPHETRELRDGAKIALGDQAVLRLDRCDALDEQLQVSLYEAAVKDGLTGVFNKRYLHENLRRELALAQRHELPLSIVIFDIDHFKKINDTLGHLAGDNVLRHVADIVAKALRTEDLLARYGGEEFVVVAKNQALPAAGQLAERLRVLVQQADVRFDGERVPITISLGVTSTSVREYQTADEMIRDADAMLYEAKRRGRNRSSVFRAVA